MRVSVLILPIHRRRRAQLIWREAEELGFHAGYTYDHLSWRDFRDGPWFGAVPTLAAAAGVTERLRLGTMVTSPNFRHPVTLAKDLMTLDDLSDGRITVGIGAGGTGFDATTMGQAAWSVGERTRRFEEFVPLLDQLLREDSTTYAGTYYSAHEAHMLPGCVQRPRVPFAVAGTGPRGMALAARHGQAWVTAGPGGDADRMDPADCPAAVGRQIEALAQACAANGRDAGTLQKILLTGFTREQPLASVDAFLEFADRYAKAGITELVLHQPVPGSVFDVDEQVFRQIARRALPEIGQW